MSRVPKQMYNVFVAKSARVWSLVAANSEQNPAPGEILLMGTQECLELEEK